MPKKIIIYSEYIDYQSWELDDFLILLRDIKKRAKMDGYERLKIEFDQEWNYDTCDYCLNITGIKKEKKK